MRYLLFILALIATPLSAQVKVSALPAATTLNPSDKFLVSQGASSVSVTPPLIATYLAPVFQGTDADLAAIAALSSSATTRATTTIGLSLLTQADAPSLRSVLGLGSLATQNGTFSGTSSGSNTGDQTITLTGDVTGSGTGSFAATLAASGATAGTYGAAGTLSVPVLTIDAKGRATVATSYTLGSAAGYSIGTSGAVVGVLNGNNTYGGTTTFSNPITGSVTGNAGTATKLAAARAINGVSFDGTAAITVPAVDTATPRLAAANNLSDVASPATARSNIGAAASGANTDITSITGSALTLTTGRTIAITGDLTYTSPAFNGSANVTATGTLVSTGVTAATYGSASGVASITFDAKGRATAASNVVLGVAGGGTGDTGTAWTAYTPTLSANSGSFTSASALGWYKQIGKTVSGNVEVKITTNGTAAGFWTFSLPITAAVNRIQTASGRETAKVGFMAAGQANAGGTGILVLKYDNTYLGGDGYVIDIQFTYEAQ